MSRLSQSERVSTIKALFLKLILFLGAMWFSFLLAEIILKTLDPYGVSFEMADHPLKMYLPSKKLGWKMTPKKITEYKRLEYKMYIETDSRGFRVPKHFK